MKDGGKSNTSLTSLWPLSVGELLAGGRRKVSQQGQMQGPAPWGGLFVALATFETDLHPYNPLLAFANNVISGVAG
jgi:hypothetical protein